MAQRIELKDTVTEMRVFSARVVATLFVVLLLTAVLLTRYFFLQIVDHDIYQTQADNNRIHVQSVVPKRGLVFDRNGELLAENLPSYNLTVTPERVDDMAAVLDSLQELLAIDAEEIERFRSMLRRHRPFEAVPVRFQLSEEEIATIAVNRYRLPGVEVEARLLRHYPHAGLFAHALGYVGRINEEELRSLDPVEYAGTHYVGKTGVERVYEQALHGRVGSQQVETNARGKVQRVLERIDPTPGSDIVLSLDMRVQRVAIEALGDERGAVVAVDPVSGGVLALVSTPTYDPNLFVQGIGASEYASLRDSADQPLFNRALQGQYPPGSTLKPVFALAGLHYGLVTAETAVSDPGFYRLPGDDRKYRDWKKWGHGKQVALLQAITESCDVYFYNLAHRMGIQRMHDFSVNFGLGELSGIDLTAERAGLLPSNDWKRKNRGMPWFPGETLSAGIGQGFMLTTPLQLAMMTAALATHGHRVRPQVLMTLDGEPVPQQTLARIGVHQEQYWQIVQTAMENVVHGARGTAKIIARGASFRMAGKTGTAQVIGMAQDEEYDVELVAKRQRDHALFIGYAPAENPQIAVAVLVENGEHGSSTAAPVARKIFDAWVSRQPLSPATLIGAR